MAAVDDDSRPWLLEDNRVLLATLATITLATGSVLLWRGNWRAEQRPDAPRTSLFHNTLATLHLSSFASGSGVASGSARGDGPDDEQGSNAAGSSQGGGNGRSAKDLKNSRSKERRRRGKDPLKDLSKGGKKIKELLRTQTKRPNTASSDDSTTGAPALPLPGSSDLRRTPSRSTSSRADSQRRSRSRPPAEDATPKASPSSRDMEATDAPFDPRSQEPASAASGADARTNHSRSEDEAVPSSSILLSLPTTSDHRPVTPPPLTNGITTSSSPSSEASQASSLLQSSRSSQNPAWSSASSYVDIPASSSSVPSPSAHTNTTVSPTSSSTSRTRHKAPGSGSGSWDWDGQSTFYRDPPPRFAKLHSQHARQAPASPTMGALLPLPFLTPSGEPSRHTLSPSPSPGPSRPRRTPTPRLGPRGSETPPPTLSSQTQIASLKGALEAAKMREEKNRVEAERLAKEVDVMRWRMNKDAGAWRRREMEMASYIQYLSHNIHLYASQAQSHAQSNGQPPPPMSAQPSPAPPFSPLSPSGTPFTPPHLFSSTGGPFPPFSPPLPIVPSPTYSYPPAFPAQHQTLSTFFPGAAPPSSSGGSRSPPDRGRKRERRAVDAAAEGGVEEHGAGTEYDQDDDDDDDDDFRLNDALAGAILKRPESLRVKTRRRGSAGVGEEGGGRVEEAEEREDEDLRFPSISDMGDVYIYREREPVGIAAEEEEGAGEGQEQGEGADDPVGADAVEGGDTVAVGAAHEGG